ncbi:related to annexin XIV [Fusarium torulosum]|uniref:Related to annexin XIV n=1 Tax=Fusarium torulosum TaxID=33205 RepID=A0AAE8MHD3_9HYPO|nr:related to annexin XIV [Fusarium torulosum]
MSLKPDDRSRKDRSRSRSRDRRSKSDVASERPSYSDTREPSYIYPEDDFNDRYASRPGAPQASGALPYPEEAGIYPSIPGNQAHYSYDSQPPTYRTASPPTDSPYRSSHDKFNNNLPGAFPDDNRREKNSNPYGYTIAPPAKEEQDKEKFGFLPQKYMRKLTGSPSDDKEKDSRSRKDKHDDDLAYGKPPMPPRPKGPADDLAYGKAAGVPSTASQVMTTYNPAPASDDQYYAQQAPAYGYSHRDPASPSVDQYGSRKTKDDSRYADTYGSSKTKEDPRYNDSYGSSKSKDDSRYADTYGSGANVMTVEPRSRDEHKSRDDDKHRERRRDRSSGPRGSSDRLAVDSSGRKREKSRDRSRSHRRDKSPSRDTLGVEKHRHRSRSRDGHRSRKDKSPHPPTERMSGLSINTGLTVGGLAAGGLAGASLANAPPSPMLESYYGTYQDMSPMPSPLLLASKFPGDDNRAMEALSPLGSDNEGDSRRKSRRARFHDSEDITTQLAQALKGSHRPETEPLIEILPSLTHDQVMKLRADYKALVKTGSERKGVNIAKHIRARLKDEDPLLMKACYSVALGMWESEAYWANFWYQGDKTRRELLIESLMGRTNSEIRYIKDSFTDKKYDNSLIKCMKEELKEDKFKKAVLLVLEERRMEEYDHYGRLLPIDYALVDQDAAELRRSVKSEKGGETAMINIIVQRSDSHLRAILQEYERQYRANFARDALKKSGNLVGELLAHILNGVINRPVRDALLIHHATSASRKDGLRRELLISRLVRYHWDPHHMRAVKQAYRERYNRGMRDAVRDATSGEWGQFCGELCIARMPDDVRKFDKVSYSVR